MAQLYMHGTAWQIYYLRNTHYKCNTLTCDRDNCANYFQNTNVTRDTQYGYANYLPNKKPWSTERDKCWITAINCRHLLFAIYFKLCLYQRKVVKKWKSVLKRRGGYKNTFSLVCGGPTSLLIQFCHFCDVCLHINQNYQDRSRSPLWQKNNCVPFPE